ncbi:MAG: lamin tail domain-containing protein [Eudoraea sp.]|nr:lamin tail domain-containing protein [Eudoraea sp.]
MKKSRELGKGWLVLLCGILINCSPDKYPIIDLSPCGQEEGTRLDMAELYAFAIDEPLQITEEIYVEGNVISSDMEGNFYNELWIQDDLQTPKSGIKLSLEQRDTYVRYPVGTGVFISLKGLWIRKKYGICEIGSDFTLFGNQSIGRIPFHQLNSHISTTCNSEIGATPTTIQLSEIEESLLNTLVRIRNIEFEFTEIGKSLALLEEETERIITDCSGLGIRLITSGYADFHQQMIPDSNGEITGILMADRQGYFLKIRNATDIQLDSERCLVPIEPKTSDQIMITEIADPDNASQARFIEIFNEGEMPFNLQGWSLIRYTNANLEIGSVFDLSGLEIGGKSTIVVASNGIEFESIYGFAPDAIAGTNSPADSNGDDNLALVDPFGEIIDLFGVVGEDGSGTEHEFEDGKAVRNLDIQIPNAVFSSNEWTIFNDSGPPGTIQLPQMAPEDFNPGIRD